MAALRGRNVTPGVMWGWRTAEFLTPDDIVLDVVARYLRHRLGQQLGTPDRRASVNARQASNHDGSTFWLQLPVADGQEQATVERRARQELDALAAGKVDEKELALARSTIIEEIAGQMDHLRSRTHLMLSYTRYDGKPHGFGPHLAQYASVDSARLADVVKRYLARPAVAMLKLTRDPAAKTPVVVGLTPPKFVAPDAADTLEQPDAAAWYRPPVGVAPPRFDPPRVEEATVGGARVLLIPRLGLPIVGVRVGLGLRQPVAAPKIRRLLLETLARQRIAGVTLRERLADLSARLEPGVSRDSLVLQVTTTPEHVDAVMGALRQWLELEHFAASTLEEVRRELLDENETENVWRPVDGWMARLQYPTQHPYHLPFASEGEQTARLEAVSLKQLETLWNDERGAERMSVAIVGPMDETRARELAKLALPKQRARKPGKALARRNDPRLFLVDAPSGDEVLVRFAWPMARLGSEDYVDGLGLSWLFMKHSYSPLFAQLQARGVNTTAWEVETESERDHAEIRLDVRVPKTQVRALLEEVAEYAQQLDEGSMSPAMVDHARVQAVQWAALHFDGNASCLAMLGAIADDGVEASAWEDVYLLAQRMSSDSLEAAAGMLAPENATVLAYGDVSDLQAELADAGYGKPQLVRAQAERGGAR
jgi:predicted Zn-dependent peptidase